MGTVMTTAVVDDDSVVLSSLSTMLTASATAAVIWTAQDGATAVSHYSKHRPDVLLIDVQMPGMDGLETARAIIASDPQARILFLTTFADQDYIGQAMELGARGYLIKQDVSSVAPALNAVMSGQIVLGAQVLRHLTDATPSTGADPTTTLPESPQALMPGELDGREKQLSALIAQGLDNRQIARRLHLSEGTVRNRITRILEKTGFTNRTQIAIAYIRTER